MAGRHAGFALVACVHESLINNLIEAIFIAHPQQRAVHLPVPLPVPGGPVALDGSVTLLPPTVTLAGGQVRLLVRALVEARLSSPNTAPVDVLVEISSPTIVSLVVFVQDDRLHVGIDPASVVVSSLTLRVLDGSLPSLYGKALTLPEVAAALQAAVRQLPAHMLRTTVDGFPVTSHIAPRQMPCGASLFELPEMFHATVSVSRIVPVVHDQVLVVGVDVAGVSSGDPGALRPLFGDVRPVWVRTQGPDGPTGFDLRSFRGGGNLAVSVNPDALDGILRGPISSASHHAFIDCHVALAGMSMRGDVFTPPLMPQNRISGLRFTVNARYYRSTARDAQSRLVPAGDGTPVSVSMPLAMHLQTYDGPTDYLSGKGAHWDLQAYQPDIELPWWVTVGALFIGMSLPTAFVPAVALLDGVLPSLLSNVTDQVRRTAQAGIGGAWSNLGLSAASGRSTTVPGLESVPARFGSTQYALDGDGIDVYTLLSIGVQPDSRPDRNLTLTADGTKVRTGEVWSTFARTVFRHRFTVDVAPGAVDPADRNVRILWQVRRSDTKEVVITQDLPRRTPLAGLVHDVASPTELVIDRNDPALSQVPGFEIFVRVYRPLLGRTKEIGAADLRLEVRDRLDRSRPYVRWTGWATGVPKESVLHRTATPGRCLMVERAPARTEFEYLDVLPYPVSELHLHRGGTRGRRRDIVCDYCFFGGPDKSEPLVQA